MPLISIPKTYADGTTLFEADLDNIRTGVEDFLNVTKLDADNIQALAIDDTLLAANSVKTAKIEDSAVTTAKINDGDVTLAKLASAVANALVPTGTIIASGATSAPTGYLACDGSSYTVASQTALHTAIGDAYGGDGGTNFNVPDLRGRFLRGTDGGAGNDPDAGSRVASNTGGNTGDAVGTLQADELKSHAHLTDTGAGGGQVADHLSNDATNLQGSGNTAVQATGGSETRPKNVNVNYYIKA